LIDLRDYVAPTSYLDMKFDVDQLISNSSSTYDCFLVNTQIELQYQEGTPKTIDPEDDEMIVKGIFLPVNLNNYQVTIVQRFCMFMEKFVKCSELSYFYSPHFSISYFSKDWNQIFLKLVFDVLTDFQCDIDPMRDELMKPPKAFYMIKNLFIKLNYSSSDHAKTSVMFKFKFSLFHQILMFLKDLYRHYDTTSISSVYN
jgi:hypothetical protein